MSSGEEFEVGEILEQRKRKGVLQYLVRWKGFGENNDSWEPAASLNDCAAAIKAFLTKKRAKSKSRSRSRGRHSKSRSRSSSRGRTTRQSRSRSAGRESRSRVKTKEETVAKAEEKEASPEVEVQVTRRLRSGAKAAETEVVATSSAASIVTQSSTTESVQVVKTSVETVQSAPVKLAESTTTMTTRSRLAVRQVENDQKAAPETSPAPGNAKETWVWLFADHIVLVVFIIISVIALSFTFESVAGITGKLVPDLSVLRQRLGESYDHFVQGLAYGFNNVKSALLFEGSGGGDAKAAVPPKTA